VPRQLIRDLRDHRGMVAVQEFIRRRHVGLAFLAVVAVAAFGVWRAEGASTRAGAASVQAKATASYAAQLARKVSRQQKQLRREANARRKLRSQQIAGLERAQLAACQSRHDLAKVVVDILHEDIAAAVKQPKIPGLSKETLDAIHKAQAIALNRARRQEMRARAASCDPSKLPHPSPPAKGTAGH
jgi:hypothetical protein